MDDPGWTAVHLDHVEALPWRDSDLVWRPVRAALGTTAIGISAYTTIRRGQQVVEDHIETRDGRGHAEIYVVIRGQAEFLLDGQKLEAPAGTFVSVAPHVRRSAVSVDPDTTVLALGGPAGFEPATSEWIDRARPFMRDEPERARSLLDELRRERPDSPGLFLGEALLAEAQGDHDDARRYLREGMALSPTLRNYVATEPTLAQLLDDP